MGSVGQSRRVVLQVRNRRVQRTWLEKVVWCGVEVSTGGRAERGGDSYVRACDETLSRVFSRERWNGPQVRTARCLLWVMR